LKAIIDLGTNTFHLLIAEVTGDEVAILKKLQIPVKIGEGGINNNQIAAVAFERGINGLALFRKELNIFGIKECVAYGTSAIRDASNGPNFIAQAQALFNIQIEVLSGNQEAELIYEGVKHSLELPNENVLVMDIGGGSVEFIIGKKDTILWKKSYSIGAARLIDRFHQTNPILDEEIVTLQSYLVHNIVELRDALQKYPARILIGSAGSFETLIDVLEKDLRYPTQNLSDHACEIPLGAFVKFYDLMTSLTVNQRSALHGMADFRVEMIVVATILTDVVLKRFEMNRLIASRYSLKEGILFSKK